MDLSQESLGIGELQFSKSMVELEPASQIIHHQQHNVKFSNYPQRNAYLNPSAAQSYSSGTGSGTSKRSNTTSSSTRESDSEDEDDGDDDEVDLKDADIKLAQLRRGANKRRGKGKAFNRLEVSFLDMIIVGNGLSFANFRLPSLGRACNRTIK